MGKRGVNVLKKLAIIFVMELLSAQNQTTALNQINTYRQKSGLIALQSNIHLKKAASAHASYMIRNQNSGHFEKRGKVGYTGYSPMQRVIRAGYASKAVRENLTANSKSYKRSVETLFSAIYHRFTFLNFYVDEIGIGKVRNKKKRSYKRVQRTFVYDLGSSRVTALCRQKYSKESGNFYMKNLCKNSANDVPERLFKQRQNEVRRKNAKIIFFPYANQQNVQPVFYTEKPHPLPGSKVSGYPISVQFNPLYYHKIKLKKFRLYDGNGKRIKQYKIITAKSDVNHMFTALEFAFMPLKKLAYNSVYQVEFEALADGKMVKKRWSFRTKKH